MALVEIYTGSFKSSKDYEYEIAIYEDGGTATGATFDLGDEGFILQTTANDDDRFDPIISTNAAIPFFVSNATDEAFITALASSQEEKYYVKIFQMDSGRKPFFYGILLQDLIKIEDVSYPYIVTLNAIDGLSRLKDIDYSDDGVEYTSAAALKNIVITALLKTGTSDLWATNDNYRC